MQDFSRMNVRTSPGVNNLKRMSLDDFDVNVVPEPATVAALGAGLAALARKRGCRTR